ncbi:hypothetical protein LB504_010313 [Fusarium proliferatum]|nr:hypothetical protein LB504_010313 [Fusarium proliferatum]
MSSQAGQTPKPLSIKEEQKLGQQQTHAIARAQKQAAMQQQTAQHMGAGNQMGYQQMGMGQPYNDIPATDPSDIDILTGRGVNVPDFSGTPISRKVPETILRAPADQQVALFQLLTENGWTVNSLERLLPRLIQTNNEPLLDWFLEHGADPNIGGPEGDPVQALGLAASQGTVKLVQKLLNGGAKMTSNGLGLFYAAGACPAGFIPHTGLVQPSAEFDKSRIPIMALLIENGAGVNDKLETKHMTAQYPIVNAVMAGAFERVKWLLSQGADPDLQGQYGSARDYAKFRSSDEMKQVLGVSVT